MMRTQVTNTLKKIARQLQLRLAKCTGHGGPQTLAERKAEWKSRHQPFELNYHKHDNFRWHDEQFMARWTEVFGSFCGLKPGQFGPENVIIDIGCGSRPAFDWFDNVCLKYHLDPLLEEYGRIPQIQRFWRSKPQKSLLSKPAENFIQNLENRGDFVCCWNVLDHTYDWRRILLNLWRYTKNDALLCIGTDFESHGDGHPGIDDPLFFWEFVESHLHVLNKRENYTDREIALLLRKC
jgi:hypothetical protein